jgi:hypothetical protein
MSLNEPVRVETRTYACGEFTGFQYGNLLMTESGAGQLIEQALDKGEDPDPVLVAGIIALDLHRKGEYDHPRTAGQLLFSEREAANHYKNAATYKGHEQGVAQTLEATQARLRGALNAGRQGKVVRLGL